MEVRGDVTDTNVGQQFRKSVMFLDMTHEQTYFDASFYPVLTLTLHVKPAHLEGKTGREARFYREF